MLDGALPEAIQSRLVTELPGFMRFFARRLGRLPTRPILFASYDLSHKIGYGRQGGTLPGQVFTHFYGAAWPKLMQEPDFPEDLAWFFAHEAGHLYQRQLETPDPADAWIHEGGAEAFAAIATRSVSPAFARRKLVAARSDCLTRLGDRSLHDVLAAGDFKASYSCGLLVNLSLDDTLRSHHKGDLFSVWSSYIDRVDGHRGSSAAFFAAVMEIGGMEVEHALEAQITTTGSVATSP